MNPYQAPLDAILVEPEVKRKRKRTRAETLILACGSVNIGLFVALFVAYFAHPLDGFPPMEVTGFMLAVASIAVWLVIIVPVVVFLSAKSD